MPSNASRLQEAGMLEEQNLSQEDLDIINGLSEAEVTVLIQVAQRLYPGDSSILKSHSLKGGSVRIMLPL